MTDREMLELAAKAAEWQLCGYSWIGENEGDDECEILESAFVKTHPEQELATKWNPLTDDGDALRLAVELSIDVSHDEVGMKSFVYARTAFNDETHIGLSEIFDDESERLDRTRRAITRAASEIGKVMQ